MTNHIVWLVLIFFLEPTPILTSATPGIKEVTLEWEAILNKIKQIILISKVVTPDMPYGQFILVVPHSMDQIWDQVMR